MTIRASISDRLIIAIRDLDHLRGQLQEISEEVDLQSDLKEVLGKYADRFGVTAAGKSAPAAKPPTPRKEVKGSPVFSKFLKPQDTPDLIQPGLGEVFHDFLGRVMKQHNHTTALDIAKYMNKELLTKTVKKTVTGGCPNKMTHDYWSRYFGITRSALGELVAYTKSVSGRKGTHGN